MNLKETIAAVSARPARSAWAKGVKLYAVDMLEALESWSPDTVEDISNARMLESALLNGASSWEGYAWGGCGLCYDYDIAVRLCSPSELKRKDYGRLPPNSRETWINTEARACYQASRLIRQCVVF